VGEDRIVSTTPVIRTSERRDFNRCQQKWDWAWRWGLQPKGSAAPALWFGSGVHVALGAWYCGPGIKRGPHPVETWQKWCTDSITTIKTQDATEDQVAQFVTAEELGTAMLSGYISKYRIDEHKLYISAEQTFAIDVPWPTPRAVLRKVGRKFLAKYVGTFDGVWRDARTGLIWLDEHKTAKAISIGHLPMDTQAGSYWAISEFTLKQQGLLKPGDRVAGIEYNFLRKGLPDDRPRDAEGYATNKPLKADYMAALEAHWRRAGLDGGALAAELKRQEKATLAGLEALAAANKVAVLGERSKVQPPVLFERHQVHKTGSQNRDQLARIQDEALVMEMVRREKLPILLNPTKDCAWDCRFREMCELKQNGGDWEAYRDLKFKTEDPYADHRKSTDD
jgi:hypothetical protein